MGKRRIRPPANESPNDKLRRLGNARLQKAILAMNSLMKLSTPFYEATPEQREILVAVLRAGVDRVEEAFKRDHDEGDSGPFL
jgi:hypothetical protein